MFSSILEPILHVPAVLLTHWRCQLYKEYLRFASELPKRDSHTAEKPVW